MTHVNRYANEGSAASLQRQFRSIPYEVEMNPSELTESGHCRKATKRDKMESENTLSYMTKSKIKKCHLTQGPGYPYLKQGFPLHL